APVSSIKRAIAEIPICLAAVAREHKVRGLEDPTKCSLVQIIVEGIKRTTPKERVEA
ncbi:14_t:CDS:2, partial [Racocetra fulgida]